MAIEQRCDWNWFVFPATAEGTWSQEDKCCSFTIFKKNQTNHFQRKKRLKSKDKNIGRKNMSVVGEKSLFMTRVLRSSKCLGRNIVCDLHFHCPWSPIQNIPLPDLKIYIELLFKKMETIIFSKCNLSRLEWIRRAVSHPLQLPWRKRMYLRWSDAKIPSALRKFSSVVMYEVHEQNWGNCIFLPPFKFLSIGFESFSSFVGIFPPLCCWFWSFFSIGELMSPATCQYF